MYWKAIQEPRHILKETSSFWKVSRYSGAGINANPKADAVNKFTAQEAIAPA